MDFINFTNLGLDEQSVKAISSKGFEEPTPIQVQAIPLILNTKDDFIGQAQTGTGKTAAFGLPIIQLLDNTNKNIKALVVTPTRELALQVSEEMQSLKGKKRLKILPIYGGSSMERQIKNLKEGVDIVVGTPGRIIDLHERRVLNLTNIEYLVLDEADEMLNMGFIDDIELIIKASNDSRRIFLFSATMPSRIVTIANKYMKNPVKIQIKSKELTTDLTNQKYYELHEKDKFDVLTRILDFETDFYGIVFCRTKSDVDDVSGRLVERGYDAEGLHGDLSQYQRERVFKKFKTKSVSILVATDVAARGLDVNELTHVINYAIPQDPESYVHRIGRTGRAGKPGTAVTFVTKKEFQQLFHIERITKTKIKKENIPEIEDILIQKKNNLIDEVKSIITSDSARDFDDLAETLLGEFNSVNALAGVLKYFLKDTLNIDNYKELQMSSQEGKTTRLFIGKGKKDGWTTKKLVAIVKESTYLEENQIKDIKIFDAFSFVSIPNDEAQMFMYVMNENTGSKRPLVTFAKGAEPKEQSNFRASKAPKGNYAPAKPKGQTRNIRHTGKSAYGAYGDDSSSRGTRQRRSK